MNNHRDLDLSEPCDTRVADKNGSLTLRLRPIDSGPAQTTATQPPSRRLPKDNYPHDA
jgi:hypothetical protein